MERILFVCTGNTCRSPMAEALFRQKAGDILQIRSAGVAAYDGQQASEYAQQVLAERGISHIHQSKRLNDEIIEWADLVLAMTKGHKLALLRQFPNASGKVFTLKEFAGITGAEDIADPYGGSFTEYQLCATEIDSALEQLYLKLTSSEEEKEE